MSKETITRRPSNNSPPNSFDALIEKAFAPKTTPASTPRLSPEEYRMSLATVSTMVPETPPEVADPESKLLKIWAQVREAKARQLETLPSKVKSLEISKFSPQEVVGLNRTLTKKKSMVSFRESPNNETVTAIFEMSGVRKQDMHVSYRVNRIIVTWRRTRVIEKMEASVKVRERQEKQYSQIIPIPEGTKFEDIRATRDGRRLTLTYPNFKGGSREYTMPVKEPDDDDDDDDEPASPRTAVSGETEFHTCLPE